ncbi:MAG TPA: ATP-binding protein [Candidatus Limnocylindria bacterium]
MPPRRLLIVDDEESVAVTMQAILQLDGHDVEMTTRGDEAIRRIGETTYDLVLTDLRLDDLDGLQIVAETHRRAPDTIVIVLTGYASLESAVKALREGAYDYLLKPCDVEELRATVSRGLERRGMGQQLQERLVELESANKTIGRMNAELEDRIAAATADLEERLEELAAAKAETQDHLEKLRELDKLKSQFLSIASHELKTPITAMSGFIQIAVRRLRRRIDRRNPADTEQGAEDLTLLEQLEVVNRQTTKLARLVDELLDVSRIESGRLEFRVADVDLAALADEVVDRLEMVAGEHALVVRRKGERFVVRGDRDHLEQVLNNLVSNAVKYSPSGRRVDISLGSTGDGMVLLSVTDQGMGIRAAELESIFGLFYRSPDREARDVGGMGLGLYISKEIVDRHGGRIWAESRTGEGTTFHVALPPAGPPNAATPSSASASTG